MPISIDRANLPGSGAPKITFNGATLWTRDDVAIPLTQNLVERSSSMYGLVGKNRGPRKIEFEIPIYGFWDNLSVLFPSYLLNFTHGARIFGTSDLPFVLLARNGDQITLHNVRLTGLANLKLAANAQIFSASARFTALVKNNTAITNAAAFYTLATGVSYAEGDFPRATFKSKAWTGAWGARAGFTSILTEAGWDISFEVTASHEDMVDGIGAVDLFAEKFWCSASAIPVGPTLAQIDGGHNFQGANADIGADVSADVSDLVLTDGTSVVTLASAAMVETGITFAPFKKRIGPTKWETGTRVFAAGAPTALATVT